MNLFGGTAAVLIALLGGSLSGAVLSAEPGTAGDLRDLQIGTHADSLPRRGYVDFACAGEDLSAGKAIAGWSAYRDCSPDDDGRHAVTFRFDDALVEYEEFKGTKVGGHPVRVAAQFEPDGIMSGLQVITDPSAPAFHARKAFLFRLSVRARYGQDGWQCADIQPGPERAQVGNVFVAEHCTKAVDGRVIRYRSNFYRAGHGSDAPIVNSSSFEIRSDDDA